MVGYPPAIRAENVNSEQIEPGPMNHLALPTADPARAEQFYCELLGFRLVPRPSFSFDGRWLYREETGPLIHLIHVADHRPPTGPINTLGHHFALQCADINGAIRALSARGIKFVERILPDHGYRQLFFSDPDGNLLELGDWPPPAEMVAIHEQMVV